MQGAFNDSRHAEHSKTSRNSRKTSSRPSPPLRPPGRRVCRTSPPNSTDYSKKTFAAGTAMFEKLLGARSVEIGDPDPDRIRQAGLRGLCRPGDEGLRTLHPGRFGRSQARHHGLREHPEVIERSFLPPARQENSPSSRCRRLPAPAFYLRSVALESDARRPRPANGTEEARFRSCPCDEALARDEQIGNAAIRRRHLAPAARGA